MIILTLAWWVAGADRNVEGFQDRGLIHAIDDVTWVLDDMILVLEHREKSAGVKRPLDIVTEDPLTKKRRVYGCHYTFTTANCFAGKRID
jgi:hypothetical protein